VAAWRIFLINLFLVIALMGVGVFLLYLALRYAIGTIRAIWGG
jgi:hypothetical protein